MRNIPSRAFNEARAVPFQPTRPPTDRSTEDARIPESDKSSARHAGGTSRRDVLIVPAQLPSFEASNRSASRCGARGSPAALRKTVVETDGSRTEGRDLQQATRHHDVL